MLTHKIHLENTHPLPHTPHSPLCRYMYVDQLTYRLTVGTEYSPGFSVTGASMMAYQATVSFTYSLSTPPHNASPLILDMPHVPR